MDVLVWFVNHCKGEPLHGVLALLSSFFTVLVGATVVQKSKWWAEWADSAAQARIASKFPRFVPKKALSVKDQVFLQLLDEEKDAGALVNYVITDPAVNDNPIIYASEGFTLFTGYTSSEICGRNCRFLQGAKTDPQDVATIRSAIADKKEASVQLLNYKKDGSTFVNQFFLMPLRDESGMVVHYVGIQREAKPGGAKQEGENAGWRVFFWRG
jgi:PAS domain S-box-containing protein